jgi:periplasmic protein TonB
MAFNANTSSLAAVDAVKQWRYKPFLVGGELVEVETTVTVTFHVRSE